MVCCVVFTVDLKNEENERKFWTGYAEFKQYIQACEPGTLTYEVHQYLDAERKPVTHKYLLLERYSNKAEFAVHESSAHMRRIFAMLNDLDGAEKSLTVLDGEMEAEKIMQYAAGNTNNTTHRDERGGIYGKGICIFGGSRHGSVPAYTDEAVELGRYIATVARRPLVYGGGTVGIMGEVAKSVKACKGLVIAVIPRPLCPREASGDLIGDRCFFPETMSERKSIMFAAADTIVALPGGIGTFDELLEVLTLFQLNAYRPKIGLVNVNGFFDPFLAMLDHLVKEGFLEASTLKSFVVKDSANELMTALESFVPPESAAAKLVWSARP